MPRLQSFQKRSDFLLNEGQFIINGSENVLSRLSLFESSGVRMVAIIIGSVSMVLTVFKLKLAN